jgi:hypothetical protein
VEKSVNVVSQVHDSGALTFERLRGLSGWCRGHGFAECLAAVSDSLAAFQRIGGAPPAHAAAFESVHGWLGLAVATPDFADMASERVAIAVANSAMHGVNESKYCTIAAANNGLPKRLHETATRQSRDGQAARRPEGLSRGIVPLLSLCRSFDGRRRERAGSRPGDHPGGIAPPPRWGAKRGRRRAAARSYAHHFRPYSRPLSGSKIEIFPVDIPNKSASAPISAENNCGLQC